MAFMQIESKAQAARQRSLTNEQQLHIFRHLSATLQQKYSLTLPSFKVQDLKIATRHLKNQGNKLRISLPKEQLISQLLDFVRK